ncbi:MAG: sensor histidine kinase [Ferruginibacter sp.]
MKYFYRSNFDSTIYFLEKGASSAGSVGDAAYSIHYYLTLGNAYTLNNYPSKALYWLQKLSPQILKSASHELQQKHLLLQGMAYERMQKTDSALHYYRLCETFNKKSDAYNNWRVYDLMGLLFQRAEMYAEAEKYFLDARRISKAGGIRVDYGIVLYNLTNFYYQWNKPEKFASILAEREAFMQAGKRDYSKDPGHKMIFANWKKEPFEKKVTFLKMVKNEFIKNGAALNVEMANIYLAGFYEEKALYGEALQLISENDAMPHIRKNIINDYINTKILYRLLKKTGNEAYAIKTADRMFMLKDSIIKLQQRDILTEAEIKFETEKREKDIAALNKENGLKLLLLMRQGSLLARETELKEALERENLLKDSVVESERLYSRLLVSENMMRSRELENESKLKNAVEEQNRAKDKELERQKKVRTTLVAGSLLLLLSGALIFSLYRKQMEKNRIIQRQSEDLKTLMKEIHHRVKNNLQVISSMLDLQSLSIKDEQAAGAVREGKIRVQSMALIHQNLYSEGNIKGIVMRDYIRHLVQNLFHSYNIREDRVHLVTDIDELNLDVDTVIPLGLILNELITNSLKYAFKESAEGEIFVGLKHCNKELQLKVKDNGCGFPPNWNSLKETSFGYSLVSTFAQKLKAKLDVYNDGGACVSMNIMRYKLG